MAKDNTQGYNDVGKIFDFGRSIHHIYYTLYHMVDFLSFSFFFFRPEQNIVNNKWKFTKLLAQMWHKAIWKGHPMRLELSRVGLLVELANPYTARSA